MQKFMPILVPFVLALLIAAPVAAQPRSDTLLRDEIASAIEDADLPIGIFDVEVRDGVAVLSGEVLNEATRSRVVELALFVDGVAAVETNITVLEPDDLGDPDAEPDGPEDPEAAAPAPLPEEEAGAAPPAPARGMATRPDDAVRSEVAREIERADLEGGDPRVSVVDGVVRLTGQVVSAWEWRDVVERAESVAGVLAVDPDLEVAEPESMDDLVEGVRRAVLRLFLLHGLRRHQLRHGKAVRDRSAGGGDRALQEDRDRETGFPGLWSQERGQPHRGPAALPERPGPPPRPLLPDLPGSPFFGSRQPGESPHSHRGFTGSGGAYGGGP